MSSQVYDQEMVRNGLGRFVRAVLWSVVILLNSIVCPYLLIFLSDKFMNGMTAFLLLELSLYGRSCIGALA